MSAQENISINHNTEALAPNPSITQSRNGAVILSMLDGREADSHPNNLPAEGTGPTEDSYTAFRAARRVIRTGLQERREARLSGRNKPEHSVDSIDPMSLYLNDISRAPLLTAAEEKLLSKRIKAGQHAQARIEAGEPVKEYAGVLEDARFAREDFVTANLRLVVSIAKRFPLPQGMTILDLVQEGNSGLEHAVDKFEGERGFKFSTYATFWIRQSIGRSLDNKASLIRIPAQKNSALRTALKDIETVGNGESLNAELAHIHRLTTPVSLDEPIGEEGSTVLGDVVAISNLGIPEVAFGKYANTASIKKVLDLLDDDMHAIVELRFGFADGEYKSFAQIGKILNVPAEKARRFFRVAMERVKSSPLSSKLADIDY